MMTDLVRQEIAALAHTMVVKIGTRPLTGPQGTLDEQRVAKLAEEIALVVRSGRRVALVSSGAVGAGMGQLGLKSRPQTLPHLQAAAALGQSYVVQAYDRSLRAEGLHAAQILLTAQDLEDRSRHLNVRNTILALFEYGAVPIINENDTVSVEELQSTFGDNDRLAALVTNLIRAPLLVILSDVDGLYSGDPAVPGSSLIPTVSRLDDSVFRWSAIGPRGLARGMTSKLNAARIATTSGENVIIANGRPPGALARIMAGESVGTWFLAPGGLVTARKRWIGFSVQPRGYLVLDASARRAIEKQGRSLLAIGVLDALGSFAKGDVVALRDEQGVEFARGLCNYSLAELQQIKGLKTDQIAAALGHCPYEEVIHRDNMTVTTAEDAS